MTEHLLERLNSAADWHRQRSAEEMHTCRHRNAVRLLEQIAGDVKALSNSPMVRELEQLEDHICEFLGWELEGLGEEVKEYEYQIGFRSFPQSGTEYVDNLIQIYRRFLREVATKDPVKAGAER